MFIILAWQFNDMINVPFASKPFVAGLIAYFLDNTIQRRDNGVRRDRGYHWWDKFRSFKTDTRSEEFYSLPFNLNKFFPSVWSALARVRTAAELGGSFGFYLYGGMFFQCWFDGFVNLRMGEFWLVGGLICHATYYCILVQYRGQGGTAASGWSVLWEPSARSSPCVR